MARILIVDDDEVDVLAIKRILINIDKDLSFSVASNGEEALKFIRSEAGDVGEDKKRLIVLLDLNMPKMNGHEFLQELRNDPEIGHTIVFVLSTSSDPKDVDASYQKYVSGYLPKSNLDANRFRELFESYLHLMRLP